MKRIHIVTGPGAGAEYIHLISDFAQAAMRMHGETTVSVCRTDQIAYIVHDQVQSILDHTSDTDLADYDLVWFRGKLATQIRVLPTIAHYLQTKRVPNINSFYTKSRGVGKVNQAYLLAANGLPFPATASAASAILPVYVERTLQYPVVVKDVYGSHGLQNYLIHSPDELARVLHDNPTTSFMAQTYIAADGDYRILIAGNQELIIHRTGGEHTHLNNTSQGGQATLVAATDFPSNIIEQAHRFADACGYELAGVDVIIDKHSGRHYFLEANSMPQVADGVFTGAKQQLLGGFFSGLLG